MEEVADRGPMVVAVLAIVVVLLGVARKVVAGRKMSKGQLPPGPWQLPVLGNLLLLVDKELPHRVMARLSKKYGPIVFLRLGSAPTVLVSDASLAKACLSGCIDKILASRPPMEAMRRLRFGTDSGIALAPYGESWRQGRKLCSLQLFSTRRMAEFESLRRQEVGDLVDRLRREQGKHVNISKAVADMTERTIFRILLGRVPEEVTHVAMAMDMKAVVQRMSELFQKSFIQDFIPSLGFLDVKKKAGLDGVHKAFDILLERLIHERQRETSTVVLDVLLDNIDINSTKTIMMELIAAGIETSSVTLGWAMAELMANPDAMRKLQEEIEEVVEAGGPIRMIEESELSKLAYMKAVVKETLRLHAPLPLLLPHMSTEACEVAGYMIPEGSRVLINAWAIGRDPKRWEEPDKFKPERFLSEKGMLMDVRGQDFELLPFGSGRRSCPGAPLAMAVVELALANLARNFSWSLPPDLHNKVDLSEKFGTAVSLASPLLVIPSLKHQSLL